MAKSTNAEIELRVTTIYSLITKGSTYSFILRYAAKEWNVKSRIVDEYIKRAKVLLQNEYGKDYREDLVEKQLALLDDLYSKNYLANDLKECRGIIESRSKLLGLNAPSKMTIDGEVKVINISFED